MAHSPTLPICSRMYNLLTVTVRSETRLTSHEGTLGGSLYLDNIEWLEIRGSSFTGGTAFQSYNGKQLASESAGEGGAVYYKCQSKFAIIIK